MDNSKMYKTHWHSFFFGFMCALALVLFVLFALTVTKRINFNSYSPKKTAIVKEDKREKSESVKDLKIADAAMELDIDQGQYNECVSEKRYAQKVNDDIASGKESGIKGTPHSYILIDDAIYEIPGAQSEKGMREFFDDLLAGNDPRARNVSEEKTVLPVGETDWVKGADNARITVIEYSDIDCPFCKKFHTSTSNMMADYADDVRWVFRHFPVDALHPRARAKAEAAECVGEIGGGEKYWEYLDLMLAE